MLALAFLCVGCPQRLFAQRGTISGQVVTDKPERPIADARIEVRTRGLATRSDSSGRFRLKDIPAGEYVVVIRALSFDSLVATLRLAPNDVVDVDFLLTRTAQALAPVKVEADGGVERMRLAEFDERRAMGFGRFIDRSVFEADSSSQVDRVLISRVPGLRTNRVSGKTVLAMQREASLGGRQGSVLRAKRAVSRERARDTLHVVITAIT